jgi:hypothetical protein
MSVESARRVTKLMMSVFRGVRDSRIGQLPRWSVEVLRNAQLQGLEMRFCRDGFGPAQVQVLAEKHSFRDFGKTTDPLRPISASPFKLASTSEYRRSPPSLTLETSRSNRQLKATALHHGRPPISECGSYAAKRCCASSRPCRRPPTIPEQCHLSQRYYHWSCYQRA